MAVRLTSQGGYLAIVLMPAMAVPSIFLPLSFLSTALSSTPQKLVKRLLSWTAEMMSYYLVSSLTEQRLILN